MKEYKTIHENKNKIEEFYKPSSIKDNIYNLDRFSLLNNGEILEDLDGEYVLFNDLIKTTQCDKKCKCKILPKNLYKEIENNSESSNYNKQQIYNKLRLLVNTQTNDMLLGESVRKLFI
jgi:hypothetical protein